MCESGLCEQERNSTGWCQTKIHPKKCKKINSVPASFPITNRTSSESNFMSLTKLRKELIAPAEKSFASENRTILLL